MNNNQQKENILYCFRNITGWRIELLDLDLSGYELPRFYSSMYTFLLGRRAEHEFVVVIVKDQESVIDIAKRRDFFSAVFRKPVAFYFDELSHRSRQRLIQRRINFIYSKSYLFVPFMGILETATSAESSESNLLITLLNPTSQKLALAYLNGLIENGDSGVDLAKKLELSAMAISTGLKQLEMLEYLELIQNGTAKNVRFMNRKDLWTKLQDKLLTPVKSVIFLAEPPKQSLLAGLTALSNKTLLVDPGPPTYAIYRKKYKQIENALKLLPQGEGVRVEIWLWDPASLARNETVDPFSLALSLRGERDERVLLAIDEMLNEALQ